MIERDAKPIVVLVPQKMTMRQQVDVREPLQHAFGREVTVESERGAPSPRETRLVGSSSRMLAGFDISRKQLLGITSLK